MNIFMNKNDLKNAKIELSFKKIKSFDELLDADRSNVIYVADSKSNFPKSDILGSIIKKKKHWLCKTIYFKLNNSVFEPTKVYRDNFYSCGQVFYKMSSRVVRRR